VGATDSDLRDIMVILRGLRDRIGALETTVAGIAKQINYAPPTPPRWSEDVQRALERGDRRGAIHLLARERGISRYLAERALEEELGA
jgi:hypothetical protein